VFGGIAFLGWLASFGIRGEGLESEGWDEESAEQDDEDAEDSDNSAGVGRR
jgi:hypothetical protein